MTCDVLQTSDVKTPPHSALQQLFQEQLHTRSSGANVMKIRDELNAIAETTHIHIFAASIVIVTTINNIIATATATTTRKSGAVRTFAADHLSQSLSADDHVVPENHASYYKGCGMLHITKGVVCFILQRVWYAS